MFNNCKNEAAKADAADTHPDDRQLRGLEFFTSEGRHMYRHVVQNNIKTVLEEQARPQGIKLDPNYSQEMYRERSAYRQRIAHLQALRDAQDCADENEDNVHAGEGKNIEKKIDISTHSPKRKHPFIRHAMRMKRIQRELCRHMNNENPAIEQVQH